MITKISKSITSTTIKSQKCSVECSYESPVFEDIREITKIFKPASLIELFNQTNDLALKQVAEKLSKLMARKTGPELISTCYKIFTTYPLHTQKDTIEALEASPELLNMFSFSFVTPSEEPSLEFELKSAKPKSAAVNEAAERLQAALQQAADALGVEL